MTVGEQSSSRGLPEGELWQAKRGECPTTFAENPWELFRKAQKRWERRPEKTRGVTARTSPHWKPLDPQGSPTSISRDGSRRETGARNTTRPRGFAETPPWTASSETTQKAFSLALVASGKYGMAHTRGGDRLSNIQRPPEGYSHGKTKKDVKKYSTPLLLSTKEKEHPFASALNTGRTWESPASSVGTQCFHCPGSGFNPCSGN